MPVSRIAAITLHLVHFTVRLYKSDGMSMDAGESKWRVMDVNQTGKEDAKWSHVIYLLFWFYMYNQTIL